MKNNLVMFSGTDCPHCELMRPLLARLERETGITITEKDTWKNESEYRFLENFQEAYCDSECQGIPFFLNTDTNQYLCGEVSYKELKQWASQE